MKLPVCLLFSFGEHTAVKASPEWIRSGRLRRRVALVINGWGTGQTELRKETEKEQPE